MLSSLEWTPLWCYQWLFVCLYTCGSGQAHHLIPPSHGRRLSSSGTVRKVGLVCSFGPAQGCDNTTHIFHKPHYPFCCFLAFLFTTLCLPLSAPAHSWDTDPPQMIFSRVVPGVLHLYPKLYFWCCYLSYLSFMWCFWCCCPGAGGCAGLCSPKDAPCTPLIDCVFRLFLC